MTAILLALTPLLPLALALALVPHRYRTPFAALVPVAPLPALLLALFGDADTSLSLPFVLLGLELGLDATRRPLLAVSALLWIAGGFYARGYIARDGKQYRFAAFHALTMSGNLGLIVALDVPGFYVFFSLMTLASYVLVVFDQTPAAYRAGRVYIVLSILGETALLMGFLRAVAAAGSLAVADIPPALAGGPGSSLTLLLLIVGFGIKAGQFPLHFWLPLAHPAAPTPASAVLSGAMIKAGLLGLLLFLPLGQDSLPAAGIALMAVGLFTAFYGVAAGLGQADPKTVLAYSSVSQMGVMTSGVGIALAVPDVALPMAAVLIVYAAHHGLAKGALFLAVGLDPGGRRARRIALSGAVLCALAVAGAPLTAGAVAKLALKDWIAADVPGALGTWASILLPLSAAATTLLMARFVLILRRRYAEAGTAAAAGAASRWIPFAVLVLASQIVPWVLAAQTRFPADTAPTSLAGLWDSLWPFALGAVLAAVAIAFAVHQRHRFSVPEGDVFALVPPTGFGDRLWRRRARRLVRNSYRLRRRLATVLLRLARAMETLDAGLTGRTLAAVAVGLVTTGLVSILFFA